MNRNWQLYLKRAFRLAELLVAFALLAVLVELLLVHLDQPTAGPDVRLIKRTKLVEVPAQTPMTPPTKAMPMQLAAKPVKPALPPPVGQAPVDRNAGAEPAGTSVNNTTINFVSLLQFRHLRARFGQPVEDNRSVQTQTIFSPNQITPIAAIGSFGKIVTGTNQTTAQTNSVSGATNSVVSTNTTGGSVPTLVAANNDRPTKPNPSTPPSLPPASGSIRLALP